MSIIITCQREGCNNTRKEYPYQIKKKNGKYCSRKCANLANAKCLSQARIGKNNPRYGKRPWNYKDGRGGKRYPNYKYWIWKRKVHNRDKNTCQHCFKVFPRKKLVAHHKKPWSKYPKLRYKVSNGQTLCRPCHNIIDPKIRKNHFS